MTRPLSTTSSGSGSPVVDHAGDSAPAGVPSGASAGGAGVLRVAAASEFRHTRAATTISATVAATHTHPRSGGRGTLVTTGRLSERQAADSEPLRLAPPLRRRRRRGLAAPPSAVPLAPGPP